MRLSPSRKVLLTIALTMAFLGLALPPSLPYPGRPSDGALTAGDGLSLGPAVAEASVLAGAGTVGAGAASEGGTATDATADALPDAWEAFLVEQYSAGVEQPTPPIPIAADIKTPAPLGAEIPPNVTGEALQTARDEKLEERTLTAAAPAKVKPHVFTYTVVEGDTLWGIAQRLGLQVNTLIGANPDLSPNVLKVGQVIRVLSVDGALHKVAAGDTLSSIARKYKVDVEEIMQANDIADPDALTVGQELILPGAVPLIVHKVSAGGKSVTVSGEYRWPVAGSISSNYGWRWGQFHHGVDIAAPYGRTIVAARSGKVIFAGWKGGYGNAVIISHGDGVTTLYGHASKLLVSYGQWVEAGQAIARVGSTGNSTGYHCHFEVRVNGESVNPLSVLP